MLGARLAIGGGRAGWGRLALTAVGVGLGAAVLLAATSVSHMLQARDDRGYARGIPSGELKSPALLGVDPVYAAMRQSQFDGRNLTGLIVQKTGPNAPLPPGVDRLPDAGEVVLSPALKELLSSPTGELLRPRFADRVVGTIDPVGLAGPHELFFYVGVPTVSGQFGATEVYRFGVPSSPRTLDGLLWLLIVLGTAALLLPVIVFVATSTRLAAAARDRRLAALRLVGADGEQVRRIAAGEAFVGAVVGLVIGMALFLAGRTVVPSIDVTALQGGIFVEDIRPEWTLVALIVIAVPLLAVGIAVFSLRRVMIEPLGVVRRARDQRRKLWWRLAPPVLGIALLATQGGRLGGGLEGSSQLPVSAGIVLLLSSVPLVLPWIVERFVSKLGGGSPAWQLAVRRLQLDSGTPARVAGGVAVVLAGAIALQTVFIPAESRYQPADARPPSVSVNMANAGLEQALALGATLRKMPGAETVTVSVTVQLVSADGRDGIAMQVGTCDELARLTAIEQCRDGDLFTAAKPENGEFVPTSGERVLVAADAPGRKQSKLVEWTVPASVRPTHALTSETGAVYATPAALAGITEPAANAFAHVQPKSNDANFVEYVRNALVPFGWSAYAFAVTDGIDSTFTLIGRVLMIGSVITLLLAAASLLVVALEQIRERRRALAVLAANGVPRIVLARSLLWQTAVPIAIAVVVAVASGLVLAGLLLYVTGQRLAFDWTTIAVFVAAAIVAVLASAGCTLPSLWQAAAAEGLRDE
ncbi:FtsX-like permease family protein [Kutzneria sp. NPDC052558]|uniref:FtsX-like permease family protein n=1 Tax=Kutzneria sp. NPDC052558 TaxID=3364121 RepID=UPI0037CA08F1